ALDSRGRLGTRPKTWPVAPDQDDHRLGSVLRNGRWVKWSAPHCGQCRKVSAGRVCASIDLISFRSLARSIVPPPAATVNAEPARNRRRAADLGTRQV